MKEMTIDTLHKVLITAKHPYPYLATAAVEDYLRERNLSLHRAAAKVGSSIVTIDVANQNGFLTRHTIDFSC